MSHSFQHDPQKTDGAETLQEDWMVCGVNCCGTSHLGMNCFEVKRLSAIRVGTNCLGVIHPGAKNLGTNHLGVIHVGVSHREAS